MNVSFILLFLLSTFSFAGQGESRSEGQGGRGGGDPTEIRNAELSAEEIELGQFDNVLLSGVGVLETRIILRDLNRNLELNEDTTLPKLSSGADDFKKLTNLIVEKWFDNGRYEGIYLPKESKITHQDYATKMSNFMKGTKPAVVNFVDHEIFIGLAKRVCTNYITIDGMAHIDCNAAKYAQLPKYKRLFLVHHEFAGLAGFEKSTYWLSLEFFEHVVIQNPFIPML